MGVRTIKEIVFGPTGLIAIAALLGAIGALWTSFAQTNFERALKEKNEEIASLNRQILNSVTGGDSFCYIRLISLNSSNDKGFLLIHQGEDPLYDLSLRMTDLDRWKQNSESATFESIMSANVVLQVNTVIPGHSELLGPVNSAELAKDGYNIFFSARNGSFTQRLRYRAEKGALRQAISVMRNDEIIFEEIDDEYPLDDRGNVDWQE